MSSVVAASAASYSVIMSTPVVLPITVNAPVPVSVPRLPTVRSMSNSVAVMLSALSLKLNVSAVEPSPTLNVLLPTSIVIAPAPAVTVTLSLNVKAVVVFRVVAVWISTGLLKSIVVALIVDVLICVSPSALVVNIPSRLLAPTVPPKYVTSTPVALLVFNVRSQAVPSVSMVELN